LKWAGTSCWDWASCLAFYKSAGASTYKNLFFLFQFKSVQSRGHLSDCWLRSEELDLDAALTDEWNGFTHRLMESGVHLLDRPDSLLWTGGDRSGALTAKNAYDALAAKCWTINSERGHGAIWRSKCSLKLKLFTWLLIENKLLLWPNLQARGWEGPSRCCLCNSNEETSAHLFIDCSFSRSVWNLISPALTPSSTWTGTSPSICFQNWSRVSTNQVKIPILLCWLLWKNRNTALFEDKPPSVHRVACSILAEITVDRNQPPISTPCRPIFTIPLDRVVAWFDGAAQHDGLYCGAGGKITINPQTSYRWTLNCGQGSNMKAELMGAWASCILASRLHISELLLLGDSKITIDWLNGHADFHVADLMSWKERTREATQLLNHITFSHIYRGENMEADFLSKKALTLPSGHILFTRWEEGNEGPTSRINL
jgi:ribonuclease HI